MSKEIERIKQASIPLFKKYHVKYAAVFGSVARGQAGPRSDVDLLVKFSITPGLLDYISLERNLTRKLGKKVDLVSYGGLNKYLKPYIVKDLVQIYEEDR